MFYESWECFTLFKIVNCVIFLQLEKHFGKFFYWLRLVRNWISTRNEKKIENRIDTILFIILALKAHFLHQCNSWCNSDVLLSTVTHQLCELMAQPLKFLFWPLLMGEELYTQLEFFLFRHFSPIGIFVEESCEWYH